MIMNEQWKAVEGYEGLYEVSNFGRVRSLDRVELCQGGLRSRKGRILRHAIAKNGYCRVNFSKESKLKNLSIHRLVAAAFIPNPEGLPEVNHKDGNKENNRADNLEWNTPSQNQLHAFATGLQKAQKGETNGQAKINEQIVREMFELKGTMSHSKIAAKYGVCRQQVQRILAGERWGHLGLVKK